jgi:acetate kinase
MNKTQDEGVILVLNSGSSSLKFSIYRHAAGDEELILEGRAEAIGRDDGTMKAKTASGEVLLDRKNLRQSQTEALQTIAALLAERNITPVGVGHRAVHGGPKLREHQLVTPATLAEFTAASHFAPLHVPQAALLIGQAQTIFACPHFLCFDNAFHKTMPRVATQLPLPSSYYDEGIYRYGFHGLSFESIVHRLGSELPKRSVLAHLGNGSSVTACLDGKSIDTSMGFTPTGGVIMGSRTGDIDPGVILYMLREQKLNADQLTTLLNNQSGMFGYSNGESDMQALEARVKAGDASAELATHAFTLSVRKFIGAYAAVMGGIDLLVFSGGIGQNSSDVRRRVCDGLGFLGIDLNSPNGKVRVVETEEERMIARHARRLLAAM